MALMKTLTINGVTFDVTDDSAVHFEPQNMTEAQKAQARENIGAQAAGNYLTEVPSGYATEEYVRNKIAEAELGGEEVDLSGYATTEFVQKGYQPKGDYALKSEIPSVPVKSVNGKTGAVILDAEDVGALPSTTKIPAKTSDLTNDSGYITDYTETDPTVPAWAKAASKPTYSKSEVGLGNVENVKQYSASNPPPYPVTSVNGKTGAVKLSASDVGARPSDWTPTAQEVGALPNTTKIPSKTSDLTNDSGFITGYTETDPTVPSWAKSASKPSYTKSEVGLGNVENVKQYSASNPPPYPVTSVNGKTGAVTVDVPTVPTKVSAFTNDAGYLTQEDKGIYYIEGTGDTAGTWLGSHADIKAYTPGLTVLYKVPVAGASPTTLNINSLGAVTVVRNVSTAISTSYAVGCVIMLTYTVDSGTAYFKIADYDANTKTSAGTSNKTGTKMFLVGAASQTSSGTTTYSNTNCYIGTNNRLYSGGEVVPNTEDINALIDAKLVAFPDAAEVKY